MDVGREILTKGEASIVGTSEEVPMGLPPTDLDLMILNQWACREYEMERMSLSLSKAVCSGSVSNIAFSHYFVSEFCSI